MSIESNSFVWYKDSVYQSFILSILFLVIKFLFNSEELFALTLTLISDILFFFGIIIWFFTRKLNRKFWIIIVFVLTIIIRGVLINMN